MVEHRPGKNHGNADGLSRRPSGGGHNDGMGFEVSAVEVSDENGMSSTWFPGFTTDEIRQAQQNDRALAQIIESVRVGKRTPVEEIQGCSRANRVLWSNWERFILEDGILYRRWEPDCGTSL